MWLSGAACVIAAADQPAVQSIAASSNLHGTALPGLVGVAVGADDAGPSSIADDDPLR